MLRRCSYCLTRKSLAPVDWYCAHAVPTPGGQTCGRTVHAAFRSYRTALSPSLERFGAGPSALQLAKYITIIIHNSNENFLIFLSDIPEKILV